MLLRIKGQVLRLKFRVLSFNDFEFKFITIEINNTALRLASFIRARVHVFHINVQIVSLELKLH